MSTSVEDQARIAIARLHGDDRADAERRAGRDRFYAGLNDSDQAFRARLATFAPGDRVLEIGCGIDGIGHELAARGVEIIGIDPVPDAARSATEAAAARGLTTASYRVMSPEAIDFPADSFDGVFGTGVLHQLDVARTYAGMARVLGPGGRGVFMEPLGHNMLINSYRRRTPAARIEFEHPLRREDLSLAARFFDGVEVETHHLLSILTSPLVERRGGPLLHRALAGLDRSLLRRVPALRWQAWIAVLELREPR